MISWGQLTINITYAYNLTPLADTLFLAGSFNSWAANSLAYRFTRTAFNVFQITINPPTGALQYKVTRGAWASVEADALGASISNRTYTYSGTASTVNIQINGWADIGGNGHTTAASNVYMLDMDFPIPQLNRTRRIWVYLPPDYQTSSKNYPVMYMHDGQNLFDQYTSSFGEWQVDESLNTLFSQGDYGIIIVGIDNSASRMDEYSPWVNISYGGGQGDEYTSWIVNNLKPFIDSSFRTFPQPEFTGIAGSSLGGLISQYGGIQYPQTFKKVGLLSPAFWYTDTIFRQIHTMGVMPDQKFYFVSGTTEDATMVPLMVNMKDSLISKGLDTSRVRLKTCTDGQHSEWFWAREFPVAYQYLFAGLNYTTAVNTLSIAKKPGFEIYPNPASDKIVLRFDNSETLWNIQLLGINGELLLTQNIKGNEVLNTASLANGIYLLKGITAKGAVITKKLAVQH